jgi:hypothetical protein
VAERTTSIEIQDQHNAFKRGNRLDAIILVLSPDDLRNVVHVIFSNVGRFHVLSLRRQEKSETSDHQYVRTTKVEAWSPAETAVIVCDVWDKHHSHERRSPDGRVPPTNE